MATQLQIRRGTSTQVAAFTGAEGEIVVNTTNDSVHVNDGSTAGGFELARADLNNVSDTDLNAALTGNTVSALTITTLTLGATAITATGTELNLLDGVTATTAELNYVDGVTSAIQTQIDTKAPLASPTFTGTVTADGLTVDTTTLVVDATNNRVGIGTSSPNALLHLSSAGSTVLNVEATGANDSRLRITSGNSNISYIEFADPDDVDTGEIRYEHATNNMQFRTAGNTERMRITSAGDTEFSGRIKNTRGNHQAQLYGTGDNVILRHDSNSSGLLALSRAGSLDVVLDASGNLLVGKTSSNAATPGHELKADGAVWHTADSTFPLFLNRETNDGELIRFRKDNSDVGSIGSIAGGYLSISGTTGGRLQINGTDEYAWDTTQFYPANDNANDLGFITKRWDDVYATNGTIQTSDRNEKQDIAELSDAEQRVAVAAKGLLRKFRWISSVEENGDDARIHFGIIAQDLQAAFTAEGLDAGRYAMFISSTWTDEDGNEQTRLGVRYSELLAFIISAI